MVAQLVIIEDEEEFDEDVFITDFLSNSMSS